VAARKTLWCVAALGEDVVDVHALPGGMAADAVEGATVWTIDSGKLGFPLSHEEGEPKCTVGRLVGVVSASGVSSAQRAL
jgi:hypothetical protein